MDILFFYASTIWNTLPVDVHLYRSFGSFRSRLKWYHIPIPLVYILNVVLWLWPISYPKIFAFFDHRDFRWWHLRVRWHVEIESCKLLLEFSPESGLFIMKLSIVNGEYRSESLASRRIRIILYPCSDSLKPDLLWCELWNFLFERVG